ncbi:poly-gamma-glutamate synthesis protein (capsule biosynthesis protein) [Natribacillus halophilus]|uniref:Poly-gamma-glutamate synthesis protein (Capsule biosynthesis protein) n=2 Tax=Natribacillus halophilus TaxID=549003 RepID=A0A1G8JX28_9BACI|nr:poly-gamma-glutamate synthesis protein (capsule biosynthesis protein) [Natribacillus halophilus]
MTFIATGDSFISRPLPAKGNVGFNELTALFGQSEVKFTNLETTIHEKEGYPSAVSGGTWAMASPQVLNDLKTYGFNMMNWATNHTLDYSHGGLMATKKYLEKQELVHAGAGLNMAEACAPKYLETSQGRVALIAATSTFHTSWVAGDQRPDMPGRPGINPLHYKSKYIVTQEKMDQLRSIAEVTEINSERELAIKEGFEIESEEKNTFKFGDYLFKVGQEEGKETVPQEMDMQRIRKSVLEAKRQADYVLISIHSHEMKGMDKSQPADFLINFSRKCIDWGAHAVIGHGPHILRGIEIYKNRPIFYSLGNFIFQNETISHLPADFYEKYDLDDTHNVADALDKRSKEGTIGLGTNPNIWESVIPIWKMKGGKLVELKLYPIELGYGLPRYKKGWPSLSHNERILEKLNDLSYPFGTTIHIENGMGRIY